MTKDQALEFAREAIYGPLRVEPPVLMSPRDHQRYLSEMTGRPLAALPNTEPHYTKSELKNARP